MSTEKTSNDIESLKEGILLFDSHGVINALRDETVEAANEVLEEHKGLKDSFMEAFLLYCYRDIALLNQYAGKFEDIFGAPASDDNFISHKIIFILSISDSVDEMSKMLKFIGFYFDFKELVTNHKVDKELFNHHLGECDRTDVNEIFSLMKDKLTI